MKIEKGPSLGKAEDKQIKDYEQARAGAYGEKSARDLAREEGVSAEEKEILDRLANRRGEKAMQEYSAEKEKNPIERLLGRMDKIAAGMREKGLEPDAAIVEKIKDRFNRYTEALRKNKNGLEEQSGKKTSFSDLRRGPISFRVSSQIPVTHKIGENGGWLYTPKGFAGRWFQDIETIQSNEKELEAEGLEIVNFDFSKQGETEFYRALGVLGEDEEAIDIPGIFEKAAKKRNNEIKIDPRNYDVYFPTNIEGMNLDIKKEQRRSYDGKKEEQISLGFDDQFLDAILAEKQ